MFSTVLQELRGYFGRSFLLAVFFPVLIFVSASLALFFEITHSLQATLSAWDNLPLQTQILLLLGGLVIVTALAYLIFNFQYSITRLFEGYWPRIPVLRALRNARSDLHKRRWDHLQAQVDIATTLDKITLANEIAAEQLAFYPPPNHLDKMMPTRVGNILRAAEIHAYDRYRIDSVIIWPRLRPLLRPEAVTILEDKWIALNFMLLISLLAALFALIWCPVLALLTDHWRLFLLCALGWPIAWVSYENAVQCALAYGEQIKSTFDLYRHDLLKALNRPIPPSVEAEQKEWRQLSCFLYRNLPIPASPPMQEQPKRWDRVADALADYLERISPPESVPDQGEDP
jgi:hypothetical protein